MEKIIKSENYKPNLVKKRLLKIKNSYGIICARLNPRSNKIEFLLVKKRITFYFTDFVLKSHITYKLPNDELKVLIMLDNMTNDEKMDILSMDYGKMWYRIWVNNPEFNNQDKNSESYKKYLEYKHSFEKNFLYDGGKKLKELISRSKDSECIWEFPKGRKNSSQEKDLMCAIREFEEETGISSISYNFVNFEQYVYSHISSNIKYVNHFYLALINDQNCIYNLKLKIPGLNYNNKSKIFEISGLDWLDLDKIELIDYSKRIYNLAFSINKILRKRYKIKKISKFLNK